MLAFVFICLVALQVVVCDDESFAVDFLSKYHYISPTRSGNHDVKTAITNYQEFMGLPATGILDKATLSEMEKPRCGIPDVGEESSRSLRAWGTWSKRSLTYSVSYGQDIPHSAQERIFREAFNTWSRAAPTLRFTRVYSPARADLKISFGGEVHRGPGESTCYAKFDGKNGVLAHAFYPENGRIHFDEAESWGDASIWPWHYNLLPTSIHEFGHALGLGHSKVKGSVMWPSYTKNTKLHSSDVANIRKKYR